MPSTSPPLPRGACSGLPSPGQRRFRISLAFFFPRTLEPKSIDAAVAAVDPALLTLWEAVKGLPGLMLFVGDPEEELEEHLEQGEAWLEEHCLDWAGYWVFSRGPELSDDSPLPETEEAWETLARALPWPAALTALLDHLRQHYRSV